MFFMAWSPVRRTNAGRFEVDHPGDYATSIPTTPPTAPTVQVRHSEGVAIHAAPESCAGHCCEAVREALTGARTGEVLSGESNAVRGADAVVASRRQSVIARAFATPRRL